MTSEDAMEAFVLVVFNLPIIVTAIAVPYVSNLRQALQEKSCKDPGINSTSYSRITGMFGAVVLTSLFWALGNMVLWKAFGTDPDGVKNLLDGVGKFFMLGAALFLPYAFNQIRNIYSGPSDTPAPPEKPKARTLASDVYVPQ